MPSTVTIQLDAEDAAILRTFLVEVISENDADDPDDLTALVNTVAALEEAGVA